MVRVASPRNFTFDDDDDSSAISSSVISSNMSSPISSPISSPVASPVNVPPMSSTPRGKKQPSSPLVNVSVLKKRGQVNLSPEKRQGAPTIATTPSSKPSPRMISKKAAFSPSGSTATSSSHRERESMRASLNKVKEHRDDVAETPSSRALSSRRYSPRKKSVLNISTERRNSSSSSSAAAPPATVMSTPPSQSQQINMTSPSSQSCSTSALSPLNLSPSSQKEQPTTTPTSSEEEDDASDDLDASDTAEEEIDNEEPSPRSKAQKKLFNSLREPDRNLKELLTVLTDQNTSQLRRVNACGAIKTLTLNKNNQVLLARTRGVVSTITSVLCRVDASEEERTRCINALMHLSVPEKNWHAIYLFPQTPEALARNMADRYPRIRYAACLAMSFLAKRNRIEVVRNRIIMYSIARVLEVDKNGALKGVSPSDRKVFIGSRLCALKMLLHLSKNKDVSVQLCRTECIPMALVNIANKMELAANILCVATLTNLTRHPENSEHMVYNVKGLVPTLLDHILNCNGGNKVETEDNHECAKCALYALQNLSCSSNCRQELANTPNLLAALTKAAFKTQHRDQQLSALHTLKNLSDDPFNLVTMTNTPGCTATLLALANDGNNVMAQYLACDTLATLSHWLLTLSTAKTRKTAKAVVNVGEEEENEVGRRTFQTLTWEQWA